MRCSISSPAIVTLAMVTTALALAGAVGADNGGVPFEASYSGTCTFVSLIGPVITVDCLVSGQGTHVGNSSQDGLVHINVLTGASTATSTVTAANGDEIFTTDTGTSTPLGGDETAVSATEIVTGGTGRFDGASGSFTLAGTVNTVTEAISYTLEGTISY